MRVPRIGFISTVILTSQFYSPSSAQELSDAFINKVNERLTDSAKFSWELGTRAQTILEFTASSYSVFSANTVPPPRGANPSSSGRAFSDIAPALEISRQVVANRSLARNAGNDVSGGFFKPLMPDGSAADPASLGVIVLISNWTNQPELDYAGAARDELQHLLVDVPRTEDGAISHRESEVQLWSDFVYMVPPFLAYYGVISQNASLITESYNQIRLYRQYLHDEKANNLWKHVLLGSSGNDEGHWSTGNAWAAAGMLRVLATIQNSQFADRFVNEKANLESWVREIHLGMYSQLDPNTLIFANYPDRPTNAPGNFQDAASTALLASTVYRLALLRGDHSHLPIAERSRKALSATASSNSSALKHFTPDGWLTPVVNPHSYGIEGAQSAEGQAFTVQMHAAWRDWVAAGSPGASAGQALSSIGFFWSSLFVAVALFLLL